jgi:hypothetical protein
MLNISKKRKYPKNEYEVYDLTKKERGRYLNMWFMGEDFVDKRGKIYPTNSYWTLKKCDKDTSCHLYGREYNNISLRIIDSWRWGRNTKSGKMGKITPITPFDMVARIHSIDDSSYGIWFQDKELTELEEIRLKIMEYVDSILNIEINGEEFLNYCESLGGIHKDYN